MNKTKNEKHKILNVALISVLALVLAVPFFQPRYASPEDFTLGLKIDAWVTVRLKKKYSDQWITLVYEQHNLLVNNGKEFVEDQIWDSPNASVCQHIALSESTDTPAAGWTELPAEITTGGLDRNTGTYQSTGVGTCTVIYTFSATASFTVRLTGLHHSASDGSDGNLVAAVAFATVATMSSGDQLEVTWTCSVTEA